MGCKGSRVRIPPRRPIKSRAYVRDCVSPLYFLRKIRVLVAISLLFGAGLGCFQRCGENRPAAAMACQALEEGAACGAIVLGSSSFERIGKRAVSGVVVQCILCPLLAIHGNIEQPHGLPRFGTMSALEHGLFWRCRNLRGKISGSAKRCRVCCRKIQKRSICTRS